MGDVTALAAIRPGRRNNNSIIPQIGLSEIVVKSSFWVKVTSDISYIVAPAAFGSYFAAKSNDRIVSGVGVAMVVFALYKLVMLVYANRSAVR